MTMPTDLPRILQRFVAKGIERYDLQRHRREVTSYFTDHYRKQPIPTDTGRLRYAMTTPGAPEQRVTLTDRSATFEVTVPYARYYWARFTRPRPSELLAYLRRATP